MMEQDKWYNPNEVDWKKLYDGSKSILIYGQFSLDNKIISSKDYACGVIQSYDEEKITLESFFSIVSFHYDNIEKVMIISQE